MVGGVETISLREGRVVGFPEKSMVFEGLSPKIACDKSALSAVSNLRGEVRFAWNMSSSIALEGDEGTNLSPWL